MAEEERARRASVLKPKNGSGRDVKSAVGVGVVLGIVVLLCVFVIPHGWYFLVAVTVASATWEVHSRLSEKGYRIPIVILLLCGQAMVWLSWPLGVKGIAWAFLVAVLLLMFTRLFLVDGDKGPVNYVRDTAVAVYVLTWIPLFGSFAAMLDRLSTPEASGSLYIATFMLCVIASDTGGFVVGVFCGSHPMAPRVSPKKSWEGFVGSLIFGCLVGVLCVIFLLHSAWWMGLVLGVGLVACATLGDLTESQFKRDLGIKDMSSLLPGHGGIMDRADSLLPSAVVTWVVMTALITNVPGLS